MREIKVRGYAEEEMVGDQWLYGTGVRRRAKQTGVKEEWFIYTDSGWERVRPGSIGQYTGLKDKNGVEIYEGDIYHQGDPRITYTVVWHDTGLKGKQNGSSSYAGVCYWQDRIEVIGNIYENPELLP